MGSLATGEVYISHYQVCKEASHTANILQSFCARKLGSLRVHPMLVLHLGGTLLFMTELFFHTPCVLEGRVCELFLVLRCGPGRWKVQIAKLAFSLHNNDCMRSVVSFLEASFYGFLAPRSHSMNLQSPQALQVYGTRIFFESSLPSVKRIRILNLQLCKAANRDPSPETDAHKHARELLVTDPGIETRGSPAESSESPNCQALTQN